MYSFCVHTLSVKPRQRLKIWQRMEWRLSSCISAARLMSPCFTRLVRSDLHLHIMPNFQKCKKNHGLAASNIIFGQQCSLITLAVFMGHLMSSLMTVIASNKICSTNTWCLLTLHAHLEEPNDFLPLPSQTVHDVRGS
jgi:hypothetical protein